MSHTVSFDVDAASQTSPVPYRLPQHETPCGYIEINGQSRPVFVVVLDQYGHAMDIDKDVLSPDLLDRVTKTVGSTINNTNKKVTNHQGTISLKHSGSNPNENFEVGLVQGRSYTATRIDLNSISLDSQQIDTEEEGEADEIDDASSTSGPSDDSSSISDAPEATGANKALLNLEQEILEALNSRRVATQVLFKVDPFKDDSMPLLSSLRGQSSQQLKRRVVADDDDSADEENLDSMNIMHYVDDRADSKGSASQGGLLRSNTPPLDMSVSDHLAQQGRRKTVSSLVPHDSNLRINTDDKSSSHNRYVQCPRRSDQPPSHQNDTKSDSDIEDLSLLDRSRTNRKASGIPQYDQAVTIPKPQDFDNRRHSDLSARLKAGDSYDEG